MNNTDTYKEKALEYHENKLKELVISEIKANIGVLENLSLEEVQKIRDTMKNGV